MVCLEPVLIRFDAEQAVRLLGPQPLRILVDRPAILTHWVSSTLLDAHLERFLVTFATAYPWVFTVPRLRGIASAALRRQGTTEPWLAVALARGGVHRQFEGFHEQSGVPDPAAVNLVTQWARTFLSQARSAQSLSIGMFRMVGTSLPTNPGWLGTRFNLARLTLVQLIQIRMWVESQLPRSETPTRREIETQALRLLQSIEVVAGHQLSIRPELQPVPRAKCVCQVAGWRPKPTDPAVCPFLASPLAVPVD
jgi:hypothetical protein